ncbi:hypothetical protein TURU_099350 [Turdus rufiventris]|nr:hypothetical protein TURU_099350 [Turdus rufiventris]
MFKGSILGLALFNSFINDLDRGLEGMLHKFADDTKLGGTFDSLEGRKILQGEHNILEDWTITFYKGKCQILHLEWGNHGCKDRLGNEVLESSAMERDLGVLVDDK